MKSSEMFPSRFLKAADLQGGIVTVTIREITIEEFGNEGEQKEKKPAIWFVGKDKGVACNKTNWSFLESQFGFETDDWCGQKIRLCAMMVAYKGKPVEAIRFMAAAGKPAHKAPVAAPAVPEGREPGDDQDQAADDVSF